MDMIGKVRRMKLRDQLSLSEIAKRTGLSGNTVKKWLKAPGDVVPKYERTVVPGKLTPFEPVLHQALATDSHRPKQGRRSGRALFAQIQAQGYPSQGHEMLFDAHTRSFQALGGITRRGIYDNMRTAVDKVQRGKQRIVNARFSAMCSHYLFDPDFCNVASGWEKGVVEKNVQDSRRRIWIEAATRRFGSFTELNAWLGERCRWVWADTAHPIHRQFTVAEMWALEREHLMPMPAPFDGYVERLARVSSTCLVAAADAVVASHARLPGSGQTTYDWQHYIDLVQRKPGALRNGTPFLDLPAPLLRLRQSLLRHPGGDRVMAQVLAVVSQAGLEPVLVAVELVLEGMAPSGSISVEHVRNVLARLNNPATPEQAQTVLRLSELPRADTARYDRLRPTHLDPLNPLACTHGQEAHHA